MDARLEPLTRRSWPELQDRSLTYGAAAAIVLVIIGCATVAAGAELSATLLWFGMAASVVATSTRSIWNVAKRRLDLEAGRFEFTTPVGFSGTETSVELDEVTRVELTWKTVYRMGRHTRPYRYWVLQIYKEKRADAFPIESGDFGDIHRLLHLGRALADELDVDFDIGLDLVEPGHVRHSCELHWRNYPAFRVGFFSLIVVASVVGLVVAAAMASVSPTIFLVFLPIIGIAAAGAFYAWGRYHHPDQWGRHTVSVDEQGRIEISTLNPFAETTRYEVNDLDVVAVHDEPLPSIFFVQDETSRLLALPDGELARDVGEELRSAFGADEPEATPSSDVPSNPESW